MELSAVFSLLACVAAVAALVVAVVQTSSLRKAQGRQDERLEQLVSSLDEAKEGLSGISRDLATEAALAKQRNDSLLATLSKTEEKVDLIRRETSDMLTKNHEALNAQLEKSRQTTDAQIEKNRAGTEAQLEKNRTTVEAQLEKSRETTDAQLEAIRAVVDAKLTNTLSQQSSDLRDQLAKFDTRFASFQKQIQGFQEQITKGIGDVRGSVETQLKDIRTDNSKQLDAMRQTVDEKLSSTLTERLTASFKQVNDQLEAVYKGLGDMQNIASGVGDLKRVLSNVKTRGILGEVQLSAILSDILTKDQYEENVATKPGSSERVEFAVKIPVEGGGHVLLPIDSKFPGVTYEHLRDAIDAGDADQIAKCRKELENRVKAEAKDIQEKYISVPDTTNFAILFLPFEGLYAEVVDMPGLIECLQRDYRVNVAGPSTMSAILNSLQMSYQTFALQKRADEVQRVLSAVKAEFPKYQESLRLALKQINTAGKTVDNIINTRTNVIERKLRDVTAMEDPDEAERVLGTGEEARSVESYVEDGEEDGEAI